VLTAGVDLAAQPSRTGAVVVDWSAQPPAVVDATVAVTDEQIFALCSHVAARHGRVGIDCPLGWPRSFVAYLAAHAAGQPLPVTGPGTQALRMRTTDLAVHTRLGLTPLSVSMNMLGVTALRAARILAALHERGLAVDRAGGGLVCEVYPAASRIAWGLPGKVRDLDGLLHRLPLAVTPAHRAQLASEHVFDALIAALTARAVAHGATDPIPAEHRTLPQKRDGSTCHPRTEASPNSPTADSSPGSDAQPCPLSTFKGIDLWDDARRQCRLSFFLPRRTSRQLRTTIALRRHLDVRPSPRRPQPRRAGRGSRARSRPAGCWGVMVPEVAADDVPCRVQVLLSLGGHVDGRLEHVG